MTTVQRHHRSSTGLPVALDTQRLNTPRWPDRPRPPFERRLFQAPIAAIGHDRAGHAAAHLPASVHALTLL